ncbi:MAG TPA: hypothetical protein VGG15_06355 [Terriglobales bacterium]|jgi:hypothetical protein
MERIDPLSGLNLLRDANDRFQNFFARFGGLAVEGNEEELRAMLQIERTLRSVGALLASGITGSKSGELQHELAAYRENLLRFRDELRRMEGSANACRSRLFSRDQHLQATRAWCATARSLR